MSRGGGVIGKEVPFRDFLFYLYQSASPSPSSTREGSVSRNYPNRKHNQPAIFVNASQEVTNVEEPLPRTKSQTQALEEKAKEVPPSSRNESPDHRNGSRSRGRQMGIVIHHHHHGVSSTNKSKKKVPDNNETKERFTPSPSELVKPKSKKNNKSDNQASHTRKSVTSLKNNNVTHSPQPQLPQPTNLVSKSKKTINNNSLITKDDDNSKIRQAQQSMSSLSVTSLHSNKGDALPPILADGNNLTDKIVPSSRRQSRNESRALYRETLGDCPLSSSPETAAHVIDQQHNPKLLAVDNDPNITAEHVIDFEQKGKHNHHDREDDDERINDDNHLCVHSDHDLSFFKNFSATTTRAKTSLEQWPLLHDGSGDDNHHFCSSCLYHQRLQFYYPNNDPLLHHYHHIYCNLTKRHSRSTPIALDVFTSVENKRDNNRHHRRSSIFLPPDLEHHHLLDYEQFGDEREFLDEEFQNSMQQTNLTSEESEPKSRHRSSSSSSSIKLPMVKDNAGKKHSTIGINGDEGLEQTMLHNSSLLDDADTKTGRPSRKSGVLSNSKSSPALGVNDMEKATLTPRRINTSNAAGGDGLRTAMPVVSTRYRGGFSGGDEGGVTTTTTTTTVTVKMDTSSLFLDTVYVDMKQDIGSAASIKLFY
ncbi:hypothetical protein Fcan01_12156 [Folsomia candida]|uniref:Uncharacterized protein n=1 Tax=Folsomia candida TaxID=158441 RepID=A0A226E8A2_FOLCA|nr:hypothetical protein Fcan01_12156 [Folsomia candida]